MSGEPAKLDTQSEPAKDSKNKDQPTETEAKASDDLKKEPDSKQEKPTPAPEPVNQDQKEFERIRDKLRELVQEKKSLDFKLENLEEQIENDESEYLQESVSGNIVKGFDQYTRSSQNRRKPVFTDSDKVFSMGNTSFDAES